MGTGIAVVYLDSPQWCFSGQQRCCEAHLTSHFVVRWLNGTLPVSHRSALWGHHRQWDKVFDLMQSSNRLLTLQQAVSWFPTVQCTHLEAGSKQIMPKAKQLGTMGCRQRHGRLLCWFGPMCLFRDVRKDTRLVLKTASGPVSGNFLLMC